jgi:hypothetical protein
MPSIIVIRLIPQQGPIDPGKFTTDYLNPTGLGPLQITAFDLSFNSPTTGQSVGTTAKFVGAASTPPSPTSPQASGSNPVFTTPQYNPDPTSGIVQQYDLWPPPDPVHTVFFSLASVATAIIDVSSTTTFENLRLVAQWGSAAGAPSFTQDFYDVALTAGTAPDLNAWNPTPPVNTTDPPVADPWGAPNPPTTPVLYFQVPAAPTTKAPALQLSSDGTPPKFQDLLPAVQKVLNSDPGASVTVSTSANAAAGSTKLQFPAGTAGIGDGMTVSGPAGTIPAGTIVPPGGVAAAATGVSVTLSQQLSGPINSGAAVTFTPDLGALGLEQCKNIAYEIVWSQQPPPPAPPDPLEDLYTNPPNSGAMLTGSNNTTPNKFEGERQQFEAQLESYYTIGNATADRLTNFVFSLSAAIACQQQSLAATQVLLNFPANPGAGSATDIDVILTGLGPAGSVTNFGVPAAYFYALAAKMPPEVTVQQRYSLATREALTSLLADLTSAINAGTVTDSESFAAPVLGGAAPAAGTVNAAQAARRLAALNGPVGAATSLAPLDTVALTTVSDTASGTTLQFASVAGVSNGMSVAGPNIVPGTTVAGVTVASNTVTLSAPIVNDVPLGASIIFTPQYSAGLQSLITSWLSFPQTPSGTISSLSYQPGDDDSKFWPSAATATAQAKDFLNLVLCALTQGSILPPPFTGALGDAIMNSNPLHNPTTVGELTKITSQQWTSFFQANPTWLPSFTQPGDTAARIATFIRKVQKFFPVDSGGPTGPFVLATNAATVAGGTVLQFPPPNPAAPAIADGMSVSGPGVATGSTVAPGGVNSTSAGTSVTLTKPVLSPGGVALNANITFSLTVSAVFVLTTIAPSTTNILQFSPTSAIIPGMSVTGTNIPAGTTVAPAGLTTTAAATSVTLNQPVTGAGVAINAPITFSLISAPPALQGLVKDWLAACLSAYGAYTLGNGFNVPQLQAAAATVLPGDRAAQAWVVEALITLDALYQIMKSVALPASVPAADAAAYTFSVVEALYARGFTSAASITELSGADFQQALAGTVAYDLAAAIYTSASAIAPPPPAAAAAGGFKPVNPDGALTNCIPPPCSSPLGPVAYLSELLQLSEISTCENPVAAALSLPTNGDTPSGATLPFVSTAGVIAGMLVSGNNIAAGTTVSSVAPTSVTFSQPIAGDVPDKTSITFTAPKLGAILAQRRGPIADLAASCANLETPLPLIDIANECLEFMASQLISHTTPAHGTVYDTSADALAGHVLCQDQPCPEDAKPGCHEPARIFAALPEYSTPAVPVAADSAVEPLVWNTLKSDFSSCRLPYSQALDVSRSYLRHFGSCRFEEMRTFRKCITEFVLDPVHEPIGFADHLWRYPVRIDIAREYLEITPEEYELLFLGAAAPLCGGQIDRGGDGPAPRDAAAARGPWQLYGFASPGENNSWIRTAVQLPEFLARTCLSYCEFFELWQSGFVRFLSNDEREHGQFPQCEPCCLDAISLGFADQEQSALEGLIKLAVFIRLWRKLKESCCLCLSFAELRDICDVLQLFNGATPNPDFVRQLAAFQMLREQFHLELHDPRDQPAATAIDADRTHILALWVGPTAKKWGWAVRELCEKIVLFARRSRRCEHRSGEFAAVLASHVDALSKLAGFDPSSATDNWHALPTHTLRLAEVLAKITQSRFRVAELLYLFTADDDVDSGDLFPLQEQSEALELPLGLPDDEGRFSLWHLRKELLAAAENIPFPEERDWRVSVEIDPSADSDRDGLAEEPRHEIEIAVEVARIAEEWDWRRVARFLEHELGFAASDVVALAQHVFPHVLERAGHKVDASAPRYVSSLPVAKTTPAMWTGRAGSPFQYDAVTVGGQLWVRIPIPDQEVVEQLTSLNALNADEQVAVQDLYFQPRAMLARFALLFPDFPSAEKHLIEERDGERRWHYFRHYAALCHRRCHIIAAHLARHVAVATQQEYPEGDETALLILRELLADENKGTASWENDAGTPPPVPWAEPYGGAFAALLGLVGTGLVTEYKLNGGALAWRDVSGALDGFGRLRDRDNAPVPTVLPSLAATLPPAEASFLGIRNGFLVRGNDADLVGGAQGFDVTWSGALLVEEEGGYEFWAGAPTPCGEKPNWEAVENCKWRAMLKRGSRSWVILSHQWPGEEERLVGQRLLRRGAYELTVELIRPDPDFASADRVRRVHAGLEIKYAGPDSCGQRIALPHHRLFSITKEHPLGGDGGVDIAGLSAGAASFLAQLYTSSLRDIRRTYQRAFKALLFAHRLGLRGRPGAEDASELGFLLQNGANFAGASYFRSVGGFKQHLADFDFNFLPIADDYFAPSADLRAKPSPQRIEAMFDWWERLFDYTVARDDIRRRHDREFWHLFADAEKTKPADPAPLLAKLGVEPKCRPLGLHYYVAQNTPVYAVTATDLEDERWGNRVWHAERWISALERRFTVKDIGATRPDLWASDDPSAVVSGETTTTGNANLSAFVGDGCLENGVPRRYEDLRRLNDGLRVRGRDALLAWLCAMNRVALPWAPGQFANSPRDLSDLLLLDVEAGLCERASRIEEAISAVQAFLRRARLHLEPGWTVTRAFAHLWDREFATFEVWRACKERLLYKENWIEWSDLRRAQQVEAFRTLEVKLRQSELAIAAPGGGDWWPGEPPRIRHDADLLQVREPARMAQLPAPHEGLDLLGTPEYAARPSWLALVPPPAAAAGGGSNTELPIWMEAAIRLGTRFWRIAAAGTPPGAARFLSHEHAGAGDCVSCCEECRCEHPPQLDEYYFWLIPGAVYDPPTTPAPGTFNASGDYKNGYQDDFYDVVNTQTSTVWQDPAQLPQLLAWPSSPTVRLAWCRVHNGQFGQPRRSAFGVRVDPSSSSDLQFLGRTADSLTFSVTNGIVPPGHADPSAPGFRYDIAADDAVVLPEVGTPAGPPKFLGALTLPAYPYFLFFAPGAPLLPPSPFSPSLAIAQAMRAHCRFEASLAWYREAFDPLRQDCTWIDCNGEDGRRAMLRQPPIGACCDSTDVPCDQARNRAVLLHYLETLVEWSDALRHRGNSPESFQQAWALLDVAQLILGRPPRPVRLQPPSAPPKVVAFTPAFASLNPRLLDLYEIVADRLDLIRTCQSARRLPDRRTDGYTHYFGNDPLREGWRGLQDCCTDDAEWCGLHSPYRFSVLVQKAQEYAARVQEFGSAFQAAVEKGDAELLASLRAGQEGEVLSLGLASQQDQWRDADWTIEALQKTKAMSQTNLNYYQGLIDPTHRLGQAASLDAGLIGEETAYRDLTITSTVTRGVAETIEASSGAQSAVGDFLLGTAGFGGSPLIYSKLPPGSALAGAFAAFARILIAVADATATTAGLELTEAGWVRRLQEWNHQVDVLTTEIQQIERQILAAQRRRGKALKDLDTHRRQIENATEVHDFLRDKFTAPELYLFLQKETAALHRRMYELALDAAREAQRAFNLERGHTTRNFLPDCAWDDLREGLLAGERLGLALRHMEKAYLDENVREHELSKHFSLRLHFPFAFLQLRATGRCEIDIPEWMFDLDYPGHFMRRIRNLTMTIPCVTGPFTGVHCRLTLLASMTRIDPRRSAPAHECCCPEPCCDECGEDERLAREYLPCADDPRIVREYGAREAIATSVGRDDSGMFQLDFNDQRYLPFEYWGAVSRWRIELPPENNYFDMDTLTDLVIRLGYTAREGGEPLRAAAFAAARRHLPGDGWRFFEVRHEFPDAWQQLRDAAREEGRRARLRLRFERQMFPFIPHGREITLEAMAILLGAREEDDHDYRVIEDCPCPEPHRLAAHRIKIRHCDNDREDAETVLCRASEEWPELYCGVFNAGMELGRKRRHAEIDIHFDEEMHEIGSVFLLCRYRTEECTSARRDMFSEALSRRDRSGRLNRGPELLGIHAHRESERGLAIADSPLGGRQIPRS